jgi:glycine/D-amino acid oxidase-like deaminating enzyme
MKKDNERAEIVICGAGIAGIAAAYFLAVRHNYGDILLVDERPPLSLTSDKSTEAYRNWWPGPDGAMIALMNRSIDLLEELAQSNGNPFHLGRHGYLYGSADPTHVPHFFNMAKRAQAMGAGPVRIHEDRSDDPPYIPPAPEDMLNQPQGCDLILDGELIHSRFPYLTEKTVAVIHARRCGWFSGQQLGRFLLERALERDARLLHAHLQDVIVRNNHVEGVLIKQNGSQVRISTPAFINAAGPMLQDVSHMLGLELPVFCERHIKISFKDSLGVLPRTAPLLVWDDPQQLPWSDEERRMLAESEETRWLLQEFPPGVHVRPEGGADSQNILLLWAYDLEPVEPTFPIAIPPSYPEVALRGLTTMLPGMEAYWVRMPRPMMDGGYYTKTRENRFLCGPLPVQGAYVLGALSGYGLMAACGAGELLALHVTGGSLPDYTPAFMLERYDDPAYQKRFADESPSGEL